MLNVKDFSMVCVKDSSDQSVWVKDYRRVAYFHEGIMQFFSTHLVVFSEGSIARFPEDKEILDQAREIMKNGTIRKNGFCVPKIAHMIVDTEAWEEGMVFRHFNISCPDIIAPHMVKIIDKYHNKNTEWRTKRGPNDCTLNYVVTNDFNWLHTSLFDSSVSYNQKSFYDRFSKKIEKLQAKSIVKNIIKCFPRKSRKTVGMLFARNFFSDYNNHLSINDNLILLSKFVFINEMVYWYISRGEDLSIVKIFPEADISEHGPLKTPLHRKHPFLSSADYEEFMYSSYNNFHNLTFSHHEYTDKLAFLVFQNIEEVYSLRDKILRSFTLEGIHYYSETVERKLYLRASDYILICENMKYDNELSKYVNILNVNNENITSIQSPVSSVDLMDSWIFQKEMRVDKDNMSLEDFMVMSERKSLNPYLNGNHYEYNLHEKKELEQISTFNLFYREYKDKMDLSEEQSDNVDKTMKFYLNKTIQSAKDLNKERYKNDAIKMGEIVHSAFILTHATITKEEKDLLDSSYIDNFMKSVTEDKNFFDNLIMKDLINLSESLVQNDFTVPINLIRNMLIEK